MSTLLERLDAEVKGTVESIGGFGPLEMAFLKMMYPIIVRKLAADEDKAIVGIKELCQSMARIGDFTLQQLVGNDDLVAEVKARGLWPAPPPPPAPTYPIDYVVKVGDDMVKIAAAHRIHLSSLEADNPRAGHPPGDFSLLWSGDVLKIRAPEF